MKKFEYKTEKIYLKSGWFSGKVKVNEFNLDSLLNDFGSRGWELVSYSPLANEFGRTSYLLFVFKREIEN